MSDEVMSYEGLGTRTQSFNVKVINKQSCDFLGRKNTTNYCFWFCKHTLFHLIVPLKFGRNLQSFSKVCVVIDYAGIVSVN